MSGSKTILGETILYDTVMVSTCDYTFSQTHRMCYGKTKP